MSNDQKKFLENLRRSTANLRKAAKELGQQLKDQKELHRNIIDAAPREEQSKLIEVIQQANNIINQANEAKKSNVSEFVSKLNNLK